MNAYPDDYVDHNLPLLLISGLEDGLTDAPSVEGPKSLLQDGGFRLRTDLPSVKGSIPAILLRTLLENDASKNPWNGKYIPQAENKTCFHIRSIGRFFTLPPRKAPPPPHSPRLLPAGGGTSSPPLMTLHSVLSPLTPRSPLYADGIMTPVWIAKHQSRLPSVFVTFFSLSSDSNTSTLLDNKIKSEITNIRSVFTSANYKTKLVVVLVGEEGLTQADIDERVVNIRRATSLDNKSLLSLSGTASMTEIEDFVKTVLNTMYPISIEYYRDLSKHARRKRNRNVIPQPTVLPPSGSHVLSLQAWNLRYEFKLAILAEFRQEMDAALRNYETTYEMLIGPDVIGTIPAWSPRFDEARLLSDIIAIRIVRCLLWLGQTTGAVKWWSNHRSNTRQLISRKRNGTETYTWETWQSIWVKAMADLISRTQILPSTDFDKLESVEKSILVHSEKTLTTSTKFAPWESLHHEGYWLNLAQRHTRARRTRAQQVPEEDRASPGQSPASAIASRAHMYDRYMSLEPYKEHPTDGKPGYDYSRDIIDTLDAAIQQFSRHGQVRMTQILQLQKAMELIKSSYWAEAVSVLTPLWQDPVLRKAGWWLVLREIGRALWTCAARSKADQILLQMEWEREHPLLISGEKSQSELSKALHGVELTDHPVTTYSTQDRLSNISAQFAFATAECHVGQNVDLQITLRSLKADSPRTIRLNQIEIVFDGPLMPINITDEQTADTETTGDRIIDLKLTDSSHSTPTASHSNMASVASSLVAVVDLSLASGSHKILQMQISPIEAGNISVASVTLYFSAEEHNISINTSYPDLASEVWWELRGGNAVSRRYGKTRDVATLIVHPKPPKLEIGITKLRKVYYTNEDIDLEVSFTNQEEEVINGTIDVRLISPSKDTASVGWKDGEQAVKATDSNDLSQSLPQRQLVDLAVGEGAVFVVALNTKDEPADYELEVAVTYSLSSSPSTLLHKQLTIDLAIVRPFEANFGFHSRLHQETWPSFFSGGSVSRDRSKPAGLKQQFLVSALVCSFAADELIISEARLSTSKILGDAVCTTSRGYLQGSEAADKITSVSIVREQNLRFHFDMNLQKHTLGDRQPVAVDLHLELVWKRADGESSHTSTLPIPRFLAPSSEPRVLLQVTSDAGRYNLIYTIENPSLHFLTFNLAMESSEDFAFSGPKSDLVSLVPISRSSVTYLVIPTVQREEHISKDGVQWLKVNLDVVDAYFGQTLRIQPACDGVRVDKQGNVLLRMQ